MKYIITLLFLLTNLLAIDGREIFDRECVFCHDYFVSNKDFNKKVDGFQAPPMNRVSRRLKSLIKVHNEDAHRFTVISFIKEYIKKPSFDYYLCKDTAIARFDVMPAITDLKDDEYQIISEWIYDNYSQEDK